MPFEARYHWGGESDTLGAEAVRAPSPGDGGRNRPYGRHTETAVLAVRQPLSSYWEHDGRRGKDTAPG